MNTLRKMWISFLRPFDSLTLEFENKELKSFNVDPEMETFSEGVVKKVVEDLIEQKMITFFDDVPTMTVIVSVTDLPSISQYTGRDIETVYIETFHYDEYMELIERDNCNVPKPLHEFMGLSEPIMLWEI